MTAPHIHRPPGASRLSDLTAEQKGLMLRMARANRTTAEIAEAVGLKSASGIGIMLYHLRQRAAHHAGPNGATRGQVGESDEALIARHLAERGITRCPTGWAQGSVIAYITDQVL
jgi:hypothetical protein